MSANECLLYPDAYGVEEEFNIRLQGYPGDDAFAEPHYQRAIYNYYQRHPEIIRSRLHNSTGWKLYVDRHHPEAATPECDTIKGTAARTRNHEDISADIAIGLAQQIEGPATLIVDRRNRDSSGNTIGCHDNFGYEYPRATDQTPEATKQAFRQEISKSVLGHLATRMVVTGTGSCEEGAFYFAQKMRNVKATEGHSHTNTLYDIRPYELGCRLEVRCNDVNISDWATMVRLGSSAMAVAIGRSGLDIYLPDLPTTHLDDIQEQIEQFNRSPLQADGTWGNGDYLRPAVEYQLRMAEVFLSDEMASIGAQPKELVWVAEQLREYCQDVLRVLDGQAHFSILADRADWAAKALVITRSMHADNKKLADVQAKQEAGVALTEKEQQLVPRTLGDQKCRAHDLAYGPIRVTKDQNNKYTVTKTGYGYTLRDQKRAFRATLSPRTVKRVRNQPPRRTRAHARSKLIRHFRLAGCSWQLVQVERIEHPETTFSSPINVPLTSVRQNRITAADAQLINEHGKKL